MPQIDTTWVWNPVANATGYRLLVDGAEVHTKERPNHIMTLEVTEGDHEFSVEAYNDVGPGPRSSVIRTIIVPRAPGPVEGFDLSFRILGGTVGGPVDVTPPDAPAAPTVSASTATSITLALPVSAANDHASYTVQRATDGLSFSNVATGVTASNWQDSGLTASTTYYYRLLDVDNTSNISAAGSVLEATTEAAPVVGDNATRINTLLAGRSPHFAYSTPADPVTTRDVTVTSAAQFNAEASTGGAIIRINTSFSGDIVLRSNCDVIMNNSATITGNLTLGSFSFRCSGARWTGGNINGRLLGNNFQDVLFDDFYLNSGSAFNDLTAAANRFDRLAFINTTIQNEGTPGGSSWAIFTLQRPTDQHQGIIFGNFKVISDALHAFRLQSVNDIVVFDSVFNPTGAASSGMRIHLNSTDAWVKDSWIRGNLHLNEVSGSDGYPQVLNAVFDNTDRYEALGVYAFLAPVSPSNSGSIINSRLHTTAGAGDGTVSGGGGITAGSGNDRVAWDGVTVPDYSAVGAIR